VGVLGATGTFKCAAFYRLLCIYPFTPTDTLLRAIGKRAHTLHSLAFFSSICVVLSTVGYASHMDSLLRVTPDIGTSMVVSKIVPVILPGDVLWLSVLFLIGILGFIAQV